MRDGISLCTDVYLPPDREAAVSVLFRTPYNRAQPFLLRLAMHLNQSGFAVVLQDCRGRYKSEGQLDWREEPSDTRSTLAWIADQEWSNGSVGLVGLSISSLGLFPVLAEGLPEGVKVPAMINIMGAVDLYSLFYRQGALVLHWALPWLHIVHGQKDEKRWREKPWKDLYRQSASDVPDDGTFDADFWQFVKRNPEKNEAWAPFDSGPYLSKIETPILHLSGWNDFMLGQAIQAYRGSTAGKARPKGHQKLVVGPWDHTNLLDARKPGSPNDGGFEVVDLFTSWLERWVRPSSEQSLAARSLANGPDVLMFVQGEKRWVGVDRWPSGSHRELFLATSEQAKSEADTGLLTPDRPERRTAEVPFDPADPVPTVGGPIWPFPAAGLESGRENQSGLEARDDVLVYTSEALQEPLILAGPVEVELFTDTPHQAQQTTSPSQKVDWSVRLTEVEPSGRSLLLAAGYSRTAPKPGGSKIPVDLLGVAQTIPAGHRLRIDLAGSNFPQFDLPPGASAPSIQRLRTGGDQASVLRLATLTQKQLRASQLDPLSDADLSMLGRLKSRMDKKIFEVISAQFGRPVGLLGHLTGWALARLNQVTNEFCIEQLDIEAEDEVLEIGFGPGMSIRRASELAKNGQVCGVDISEVMLRQARRRNSKAIGQGRVELKLGTVSNIPFKQQSRFHKVFGVNSIQLWPKPVENLRDVRRLMKPGGTIALALQPQWLRTEAQVRALGGQKMRQLQQAGFSDVRLEIKRMPPVPAFCVIGSSEEPGELSS